MSRIIIHRILPLRTMLLLAAVLAPLTVRAQVAASDLPELTKGSHNRMETISDLSRAGKHFEAIVKLITATEELNLSDKLAAAKSAWALGLVQRARALWDEALANKDFQDDERARASLGRAIIELQESNFEAARAISERD